MDIFKSFATAMDRQILSKHDALVEKYKTENAEFLKSEKCQQQFQAPPTPPGISDAQLAIAEIESGGVRFNYHRDNI